MPDGSIKYLLPGQSADTADNASPTNRVQSKPAPEETPVNKLSDDPAEFDEQITPYKVMVRPLLQGISRMSKMAGADPLDKPEMESGEIAFAALMYQYGGMLDARVLIALWLGGVALPRAMEVMARKAKEEKATLATIEAKQRELQNGNGGREEQK